MDEFRLLIDGRLVAGASQMEVVDPASGEVVALCPRADAAQVEQAVGAARRAFSGWAALSWDTRRERLLAMADGLEARSEEMARLLTAEQGKPLAEAAAEVGGAAAIMRAVATAELAFQEIAKTSAFRAVQHHAPLGVVAAITPWNFPVFILASKITGALLTGNTVVAKPAPTTPLTSLRMGEIFQAHLPPGVLNIVTDQNDLGGLLTGHVDVAKVTFTGSTATGKKIMANAASTLKRLTLELGGNDAAIVLDDVDPAEIAPRLLTGATVNAGQVCVAIKRVYAPARLYDELCDAVADLAGKLRVGAGLEPDVAMGPVQNAAQFQKLRALLDETRTAGTVIAGGEVGRGPGFFISPTVVRDIPDEARVVREEQFGPVLPMLRYDSLDEAIARANATPYGLAGTVWSRDRERGLNAALKVESGTVWVNTHMDQDPTVPFGGAKQSGLGVEFGLEGLAEFTQRRVVYVAHT